MQERKNTPFLRKTLTTLYSWKTHPFNAFLDMGAYHACSQSWRMLSPPPPPNTFRKIQHKKFIVRNKIGGTTVLLVLILSLLQTEGIFLKFAIQWHFWLVTLISKPVGFLWVLTSYTFVTMWKILVKLCKFWFAGISSLRVCINCLALQLISHSHTHTTHTHTHTHTHSLSLSHTHTHTHTHNHRYRRRSELRIK